MKKLTTAILAAVMALGILAPSPASAQPTQSVMVAPSFRVATMPYTRIAQGYGRDVCVGGHWDGVWNSGVYGSFYAIGEIRFTTPAGPCAGGLVSTWVEVRAVPSFMDPYGGRYNYNKNCPMTSNGVGAGGSQTAWWVSVDCRPRVIWGNCQCVYQAYWQPGFYWFTVQVWLPVEQAGFVTDSPVNQVW